MARQPRQMDQRAQAPHLPWYRLLSRSCSRTGDAAQISRNEFSPTFPRAKGSRRQGVTVPSARMVNPATPAAQPPSCSPRRGEKIKERNFGQG
jgi:hypothetical protein